MAYPAAKSGFSLEDLTKMGPDEITRKRKLAEALLAESQGIRNIRHPLEGMAQMAQALIGNLKEARLDRAEREGREGANTLFSAGMGMGEFPPPPGGSAATGTPVNPNVADGRKGDESYPPVTTASAQVGNGEIETYIRQAAQARGIDPDVAVRVARSEGGLNDPFRQAEGMLDYGREESFGPFQLHMRMGGVGTRALAEGIDPRKDWKGGIDYALNEAARKGWGQWFGAAKAGIGNRTGLERAQALAIQRAQEAAAPTQVASLDPTIGVPPAANAMLPPTAGAPGQEAIAKALLGSPADAMAADLIAKQAANPGAPNISTDTAAFQPPAALPTPAAPTVAPPGTPPAAQVPIPAPAAASGPVAPVGQGSPPAQVQLAQALTGQPDIGLTMGAPAIQPGGPDLRTLMNMAGNEFMSPNQMRLIEALTGRQMEKADRASDPEYQLGLELKRAQLDAAKRPPKAWQKLDDDTLFDPVSGETRDIGPTGGPTKFEGTGLEAQAWNILQSADPSSREYATAYSIVSQPKTQLVQTENGMMPVEVPPNLPGWLKAPGDTGAAGAGPASSAEPPKASESARAVFDELATGKPPAANPAVIPGTKKAKTESENRYFAIGNILLNEVPTLGANFKALSDPKGQLLSKLPGGIGNMWQSEEYQRAANSVKTSISSILYALSGASSNPGEVINQIGVLTPQFGEKPGAIADKLNRFKTYVKSVAAGSNDEGLTKMVDDALAKMDIPAEPTGADAEGWKELAPGVKIRPKAQ